ncbi:MAG: hypothetical protein JSS86_07590 [Cyanobacteria bacterium SZAS LIN-2]|nr:hypothetical protein [Cyanobacteria bacterium SZAS LIN-3]MBS1996155.1 hypothetical protein [Cyanobacteria bacterium SZAS LIN-2]
MKVSRLLILTILSVSCILNISSALAQEKPGQKAHDDAVSAGAKFYAAKKYDAAIKSYETAWKSGLDDGQAGIMLGYCYYAKHQYPSALKQYNDVAEHGKLISIKNNAQKLARTLDCYMRGVCPGNCLKPSMPGWRKMTVPGCPDRLVWMVYPYLDPAGAGGSEYWSNDHMGEVIEYVNGRPVNKGKCPICGGTGKVKL